MQVFLFGEQGFDYSVRTQSKNSAFWKLLNSKKMEMSASHMKT